MCTPLTPAMGYLEMLPQALAAGEPERAAHCSALALEQLRLLNALVGDLLDVSRLHGGKRDLDRDEVALAAVVRRVCAAAQIEAGAQGQTVTVRLPLVSGINDAAATR